MIMKKEYIKPEMSIVFLGDDIMQVIIQGSDTNDFAKKHSFDLDDLDDEDIESDEPNNNLWDDYD